MIRWLVRLSANNSVLVNIIFWVICIAGIFAWNLLPKEQFPKVQVDRIAAIVIYPGASAESVETAIIRPVEEAIRSVDGIKHYYSDATGFSTPTFQGRPSQMLIRNPPRLPVLSIGSFYESFP